MRKTNCYKLLHFPILNNFGGMTEFFFNHENDSKYQKKSCYVIKMGVTDFIFELNYIKLIISAILKRHCFHGNSG
jgi:hypothetical protein